MLTLFRRLTGKPTPTRSAVVEDVSAPHRQRYSIEVAYYHTAAGLADCLAVPLAGRRVVLFGGAGPLPAELAEMTDRVVRAAGVDPYNAAVVALAGLKEGDTLTVLLPDDWSGPPAEALIDHARRWFSSPHSSEDEQVG
jgi:hypothetical protein